MSHTDAPAAPNGAGPIEAPHSLENTTTSALQVWDLAGTRCVLEPGQRVTFDAPIGGFYRIERQH